MLKNYFRSALRSLLRDRTTSLLNLAGLTLGIAGSLILFLVIHRGNSFDQYHSKADRIYRVVTKYKGNNGDAYTQGIPPALPEAFKTDFPEAEEVAVTSYRRGGMVTITGPDGELKKYEESKGIAFTEPSFFRIFDRDIIVGSAGKGLDEPNEAIISKQWAAKYFGRENVTGEIIRFDDVDYKISAVMDDYPSNTDYPFDLMLSYSTIKGPMEKIGWEGNSDSDNCYFLLKESESLATIEQRLTAFAKKYIRPSDDGTIDLSFLVQPLSEIHSDMRFGNYHEQMSPALLITFIVIAVFLLATSCINFVNLATAEAIKRTREVGIRKVLGSSRLELILKHMTETVLLTSTAVILALAATQLALQFLNPFLETTLSIDIMSMPFWGFVTTIIVSISLLSGLYPAISASSSKPVLALKNQVSGSPSSGGRLRRGLVVAQFFISQCFLIVTLVVTQQMDFIANYDIGYDKDAIITVPIPSNELSKMRTLKNEILALPGVEKATLNNTPPTSNSVASTDFFVKGNDEHFKTQFKQVDHDYLDVFEIELLAGENLAESDSTMALLVNSRLAKTAGFERVEDIVGREIELWGDRFPVKGVIKNFNSASLENRVGPLILFTNANDFRKLSIKVNPSNLEQVLTSIEAKWSHTYPEYIFSYSFLDQQIANLYRSERRTSAMIAVFSGVAVLIGCLGLFGLVTFMANRKTKEIGLRKVLGASVQNIIVLFSMEFVKLLVVAFVFAAPAAGFMMHAFLQEYAYRITLGPTVFLLALIMTFLVAFLTVGYRSFRAANANPVSSLRSE